MSGSPGHYATGFAYWPTDALQLFTAGNGLFSSRGYNGKLQPACDMVRSGALPEQGCQDQGGNYLGVLTYNWGTTNNNGNLQSATEGYGSKAAYGSLVCLGQTYYPNYDGVNRLTSVLDSGGYSRSFGYDQFGNMWITGSTGITPAGNSPTGSGSYNSKNQITTGSATFDAAGNQTFANGNTLVYDAENRQISETDGTTHAVTNYIYDGDGRRVEKVGPSATVVYVYDVRGVLASEYSTAANNSTCTTCYLFWDHLGTIRLVADQNGSIIGRHDYLPYGEEILAGSAGRPASQMFGGNDYINQRFTGKERDLESGLDFFGARYYGSALGRWTSPDLVNVTNDRLLSPSATLNKYVYGADNPLKYIDPDGKDITVFYEPGFPTGHFALAAYNQKTSDFAYLSVGPQTHLDPSIPLHPFSGVPGNSEFSLPTSVEELRHDYAALTIQTSPEVAQQAIDAIRNGAGTGNWALFGNQCSSSCAKVLQDIGILESNASPLPWNPHTLWNSLLLKYGKDLSRSQRYDLFYNPGALRKTNTGNDYGNPRYGMNTFDWLMLMLKAPLKGCVSVSDSASGSRFGGCQ